jgi:hypothetical protein
MDSRRVFQANAWQRHKEVLRASFPSQSLQERQSPRVTHSVDRSRQRVSNSRQFKKTAGSFRIHDLAYGLSEPAQVGGGGSVGADAKHIRALLLQQPSDFLETIRDL